MLDDTIRGGNAEMRGTPSADFPAALRTHRLLPAVVVDQAAHAVPLGRALLAGGLPLIEITFRTPAAAEAIRRLCGELPDLWTGAGTVLTRNQLDEAARAGARFILSPGLNESVVKAAQDKGLAVVPGVMTASENERAMDLGLDLVKFFPAEAAGGTAALKAFAGPYPDLQFVPTGGISPTTARSYLTLPNVAACGGSWMAPRDLLREQRFADIELVVRDAVGLVQGT